MDDLDAARPYVLPIPGLRELAPARWQQALRYWYALHFERRRSYTYTRFLRLPTQFAALTGPVLEYLGGTQRATPLRIVVVGCSTGAEAYSISSVLLSHHPQLPVVVDAFDIDPEVIETGRSAAYDADWVLRHDRLPEEFAATTFERRGNQLVVRPEVAARVQFQICDILNTAAVARVPAADVVFAQNMLCNMQRPMARRAFRSICTLLGPRSALFIEGMDLDMRSRMTRDARLEPFDHDVRRIHEEAREVRGLRYPWFATGLEPWSTGRRDSVRRYATVFLKGTRGGRS